MSYCKKDMALNCWAKGIAYFVGLDKKALKGYRIM